MRLLPVGDRAFLVELPTLAAVLALHRSLRAARPPGVVDLVPAARTLLVRAVDPDAAGAARALVASLGSLDELWTSSTNSSSVIPIEVVYDGEDLADVARLTGLSTDGIVAAHTGQLWTAAFGGFAPGFTYCIGENHTLDVPRRATPRTMVPAGSVGLAGEFSGVYPRASPGGWQLIGRSPAVLWDARRDPPALVAPGQRVRYVAVRDAVHVTPPPPPPAQRARRGLGVRATGPQALLQDAGRPGHAHLGVSESGAADAAAAARANALVGNAPEAVLIEALLGGLALEAIGDQVLAVTGADPTLFAAGTHPTGEYNPPVERPFVLPDGHVLVLGEPAIGLRSYVAVRGGIEAPRTLGSAATDLLSGEGPPPLRPGDALAVGDRAAGALGSAPAASGPPGDVTLNLRLGPRDDWFTPDAVAALFAQRWTVTPASNRVGVRLAGEPLARAREGELASEPTVAGAVQVPADGLPVVFGRDHPVTGGYPVIGVVDAAGLDALAQVRPGGTVRFVRAE